MKYSGLFLMSLLLAVSCNSGGGGGGSSSNKKKTNPVVVDPVKPIEEDNILAVKTKRKVELQKDFSNFEDFKDNINNYLISFEAESGHFMDAEVECSKNLFDRTRNIVSAHFDSRGQKAKLQMSLEASDPIEVEVECLITDRGIQLEKKRFALRKSFVVSGTQNAYALGIGGGAPIEALVIENGATLSSDGTILQINLNELISQGGKLVTFASDKNYHIIDDQQGASGGLINIVTKKAWGELAVELRGLRGGKQTKVPAARTDRPPRDPRTNGGCGSRGDYSHNDGRCFGKPGPKGYRGLKGFVGYPGGDTGSFQLKSTDENKLKLNVQYFPGEGGEGGAGGEGSAGGPGGIGNTVSPPREHADVQGDRGCPRCSRMDMKSLLSISSYKYPDGAQGPKGDQGESGDKGTRGGVLPSLVEMDWEAMKFEFNDNWKNY